MHLKGLDKTCLCESRWSTPGKKNVDRLLPCVHNTQYCSEDRGIVRVIRRVEDGGVDVGVRVLEDHGGSLEVLLLDLPTRVLVLDDEVHL